MVRHAVVTAEGSLAALGVSRPKALLILGHMRSGSSLLLHLLMTNPEVSAVGERNVAYATTSDLARLAVATRLGHPAPLRPLRYVADQVNHNKFTPNVALLQDARVRVLFLLRAAQPTIESILDLSKRYYDQSWSVSRAVDYYVERLEGLMHIAARLSNPAQAAVLSYEALLEQPQVSLEALRLFLGLRQPFTTTYSTYAFTGSRGDPGPNIAAGKIVGTAAPALSVLDVPELTRATAAHARCTEALSRLSLVPPAGRGW